MIVRDIVTVEKDRFMVNGCKVRVTYSEDREDMEILQRMIHDTLRPEYKESN